MEASQKEALSYLKQLNQLPEQLRGEAMAQMGSIFGFGEGGSEAQSEFFDNLTQSPFYQMLSQGADEAYLRQQGVTGDLLGGASITGVTNLENENRMKALDFQLGGIESLMGLPDYSRDIVTGMTGLGETRGQGIMDVARAKQAQVESGTQMAMDLATLAISPTAGLGYNPFLGKFRNTKGDIIG
jgi:hypothetical protein